MFHLGCIVGLLLFHQNRVDNERIGQIYFSTIFNFFSAFFSFCDWTIKDHVWIISIFSFSGLQLYKQLLEMRVGYLEGAYLDFNRLSSDFPPQDMEP